MNRRIAAAIAAAAVLGGCSVLLVPQHAASIARLLSAAVAVVVAGLVLVAVVPVAARRPVPGALDRLPAGGAAPLDPPGLLDARRDLRRARHAGEVPEPVRQRLWAAATVSLRRIGIDLEDRGQRARAEALVDTGTWRVLTGRVSTAPARVDDAPAAVATAVHEVLDHLEHLTGSTDDLRGAPHVHR